VRERVNKPAIIHFLVLDRPSEHKSVPQVPVASKRGFRESRVHDHGRIEWMIRRTAWLKWIVLLRLLCDIMLRKCL